MSHTLNKYEILYKQEQISSDSFERRKNSLERWKERNYQLLESKKNKYLMFYGNLNELMSIMKDKNKLSGQRSSKDGSLNDSDIKFSDNKSISEFSNRHERRVSGNYLKTNIRNYVKDTNHYSFTSTEDKNRQRERLNTSKDSEMLNDRLSRLEILKSNKSSKKGPVMVKDDSNLLLNEDTYEIGQNSEGVKLNPNLDDYTIQDDKKLNHNKIQEFLKAKMLDEQKTDLRHKDSDENKIGLDTQIPKIDPKDSDELIAFPSDDEASKRFKNQMINDINSVGSQSKASEVEHDSDHKDQILKKPGILYQDDDQENINEKSQKDQDPKIIVKPKLQEQNNSEVGFPDISTGNNDSKANVNKIPDYDLINEVIDADSVEDAKKSNSDTNVDNNLLGNYLNEENKSDKIELMSLIPKIENDDILIESLKSNIRPRTEEPKQSPKNENEIPGFTDEDHKINQSFKVSVVPSEDDVPEKPYSLDLDDIPKIEHVPESENELDSKS